jgi:hypothetical protein
MLKKLYVHILISIVVGVLLGSWPQVGVDMKPKGAR